MNYALLGKRIRDERLLLRWTLEKLAERTDKSINFIGQIERGKTQPGNLGGYCKRPGNYCGQSATG